MDLITLILDLTFLLIALAFFPTNILRPSTEQLPTPSTPLIIISDHTSPTPSPLPTSSSIGSFPVDNPKEGNRPQHKRKSVSFSLSAIHDFISPLSSPNPASSGNNEGEGKAEKFLRRPPTPYVSGPVSPSRRNEEMKRSLGDDGEVKPGLEGLTVIGHAFDVQDPMGVKKSWLMG